MTGAPPLPTASITTHVLEEFVKEMLLELPVSNPAVFLEPIAMLEHVLPISQSEEIVPLDFNVIL